MRHAPDAAAAEAAAAAFLEALGWDLDHEHTRGTPGRMARAYAEMLTPEPFTMTAFGSDGGGLVTVRGIGFTSVCAHHALPFAGTAEVTYAPGGQVAGLSKIARIVQAAARGPQVQELMTGQVADALMDAISPRGVTVRLEAAHLCLTARGARAAGTSMITSAARGTLAAGGCCQAPAGGLSAGGPLLPEGH
jgi:GTP cyclohydrolase I